MLNRYLMIALMIVILPIAQLSSGAHHSYVLTDQEMLADAQISQDLSLGANDHPDKAFTGLPLVIALFLLGTFCLFTMIVSINRTKQLMIPVFYQSNFVI